MSFAICPPPSPQPPLRGKRHSRCLRSALTPSPGRSYSCFGGRVSSTPPELHSTEIWWLQDRLRWNEGQENHMDGLGLFFLAGGPRGHPGLCASGSCPLRVRRIFETQCQGMRGVCECAPPPQGRTPAEGYGSRLTETPPGACSPGIQC